MLIAPFLLGAVFLGAVAIGRRVAAPIEAARQRQVEFTADASHELRTPLSVIEAHTSLALAGERDVAWYRTRLCPHRPRVEAHAQAARGHAVAAPGSMPPRRRVPPNPWTSAILAAQAADRFAAVAETRRISLAVHASPEPAVIAAPADLVDRLIGVLLDNACKYAPEGGRVDMTTAVDGARASVTVEDDGPGIAARRAVAHLRPLPSRDGDVRRGTGAGLGLAIGDAIVRATGGRWSVGSGPGGGARFAVSWSRSSLS